MKSDTIDQNRVLKVLIENAEKGYDAVNIHGGEPTSFKNFLDILKVIKSLGYPSVILQTNGRRMCQPEFVRRLKELNVSLAVISLHGSTSLVHDWLTKAKGSFSEAIEGIRNAIDLGIAVRTNTVICRQNITQLVQIIDLLNELGVKFVNISNIHPVGTAFKNFDTVVPNVKETTYWVTRAAQRALETNLTLTLEGFPYCVVPGFEDYHLESKAPEINMEFRGNTIDNYFEFMGRLRINGHVCDTCIYKNTCTGVYREYVYKRGWVEFEESATCYQLNQKKV